MINKRHVINALSPLKCVNFDWKFHFSDIICIYLTFLGILYPPSSESTSWYLPAHGAIAEHLKVSFITWCKYLKTRKYYLHTHTIYMTWLNKPFHFEFKIKYFCHNRFLRWLISLCSHVVEYQDEAWQDKTSASKFLGKCI